MTRAIAFTALVGTTLTACTALEPPREPPALAAPASYTVVESGSAKGPGPGAPQALPGAAPVPQWWKAYGSDELDQLVEEGLAASPSLAAAQSSLKAAREGLKEQIGDNSLPKIDASFGAEREQTLGLPIKVPGVYLPPTFLNNVFTAQVQASYTFDFFGAAFLANRALAGQLRQQTWQLEATRRSLAASIVMATITVASLHEQLAATQQLVDLGEERARQLAGRYRTGSATHDEALSAEQDAADAAAVLPALRAQLAAARHAQAVLLGRTPDRAPEPLPLDRLQPPAGIPVSLPSELLHQRPDILAAESAVQSAADAAGASRAALFPSLSLSAAYGRGAFDWSTFSSPAGAIWGVGASVTQPLFHGGALRARARSYLAQYDTAVAQYRQTVLSAFRSVADTLAALQEDGNTLVQTQRAQAAASELRGSSEAKYRLGATSFYITLTAGQQYLNAHLQHIRARASQLTDSAALLDAMGDPPAVKDTVAAAR
jgi:NodT family efflux transporter outer membrane factor (OMF) lipoprotein